MALKESAASTYNRVRIGAVLVLNNKVVGKGANLSTSHPLQSFHNLRTGRIAPSHHLHAEIHALVDCDRSNIQGAEIYVGRFDRLGKLAMCKPCVACEDALRRAGVNRVVYTSNQGVQSDQYL
jgi:deoxycytidylate deaminase